MLQQFFGGIGKINIDPKHESSKYTIIKLNDLKNVIIPHFYKYPLLHLRNEKQMLLTPLFTQLRA
jgi:LAGLIDADG endonuclease